jgi:hypothetical protein
MVGNPAALRMRPIHNDETVKWQRIWRQVIHSEQKKSLLHRPGHSTKIELMPDITELSGSDLRSLAHNFEGKFTNQTDVVVMLTRLETWPADLPGYYEAFHVLIPNN